MKALFFATVLTAATFTAAFAAEPKATATITGDSVTVGDVFDGAGAFADRYLAPAPDGTMVIDAHDLQRISDTFSLGWQQKTGRERAVLRRETGEIDQYAIEGALQAALSEKMPGRKFDTELTGGATSLRVAQDAEKTVEAGSLRVDMQKGTFTALLAAPAHAPTVRKEVSGRIYALNDVPVLKAPLRAGDLIDAHDIEYVEMRDGDITASTVVDADKLIGQTPRRGIAAMKPVMAADIESPLMVKKGELVTVALQTESLNLTMQARAMQAGAEGETVRIVNTASNRMLEGVVTGPGVVALKM